MISIQIPEIMLILLMTGYSTTRSWPYNKCENCAYTILHREAQTSNPLEKQEEKDRVEGALKKKALIPGLLSFTANKRGR